MTDPKSTAELCAEFHALYVEDEADIREPIADTLREFFARVTVAEDGREATEAFERERPDLLITDIRMPVMDGFQLIKWIRQQDSRTPDGETAAETGGALPVLVLSAHNDPDYYAQAIRLGVDGFVLKPLELEQLLGALSSVALQLREHREVKRYREKLERLVRERTNELAHRLVTDELTGLPNRNRLRDDLKSWVHGSAIQVDLDGLARINTGFGLQTGDWVIQETAALLMELLPDGGKLYRLAGDEYLVLLPGVPIEEGRGIGESIKEALANQTLTLDDAMRIPVIHTVGVTSGPAHLLLEHARLAIAEARRLGRNRLAVLTGDTHLASKEKLTLSWIHRVREALNEDRVEVHYQPIVDNQSGGIIKYEALVRIVERGELITPNHFILSAQLGGLMPKLTARILDKVIAKMENTRAGFSVNLTSDDLLDGTLLNRLQDEVETGRLEPRRLTFEVLEGITLDESGEAMKALLILKELGFGIAIDDFGAEQSHFSRIPSLRADTLKIDGQFIKDIDTNPTSQLITHAIVQLAKGLGIKVVAEFVHSEAVQARVKALGIEFSQGFHLGKPSVSIDE